MMSFEAFRLQAGLIPYQYRHPEMLYALVRWLRPQYVVEVGTHLGMSAVWMARALQENGSGHLWCIDNFCWREEVQEPNWHKHVVACGVRDVITLIQGRSQEVQWPITVDMAYVDGNHVYEVCCHDVYKAVFLGAECVALHDTVACEGTRNLADHLRSWSDWDFLEVEFEQGLLIGRRRMPKGPIQQLDREERWDRQG